MADLDPIIRLNKFRLEEKQRALSKLYSDVESLETERKAILDSIESEKHAVDENLKHLSLMTTLISYIQKSKEEIEVINNKISSLEIKITRSIDEMRDAFGELKKFEITRDRRLDELAKENQKREDDLFSEIALEMYRRGDGQAVQ